MSNAEALSNARSYHEKHKVALGLPEWSDEPSKATVDQERGRLAGAAFDALKHSPHDPDVKASYAALKKETLAQYGHLIGRGVKIEPWTQPGQPYKNSADMVADARNKHLWYFPTDAGFGTDSRFADHPMMEEAMPGVRYNDLFRAVHDYFGHAVHGHQFGPQGELRAWHEHARLFSPLARRALTTETHGQNSWVNFGPHEPWKMPMTERPYADQKAALIGEDHHPTRLARKPPVHPEEAAFTQTLWSQWQAWRKHLADNERRGKPNVHEGAPPIMDDNARLVFADWLADRGDPREAIVRGHKEQETYTREGEDHPRTMNYRNFGKHPETMHKNPLFGYDAIARDHPPTPSLTPGVSWDFSKDAIHPGTTAESSGNGKTNHAVPSVVWRHKGITTARPSYGTRRFSEHPVMFHAPVTTEQYFAIADSMPEAKRKQWEALAEHHGWKRKVETPTKLARVDSTAAGVGQLKSRTHDMRLNILRHVLKEARLTPSTVRAALAGTKAGLKPSVIAAITAASSAEHAQYAAAWYGLLSGEPRLTTFHPGDGEDSLHVIDTEHSADQSGDYARKAGVPTFAVEQRGSGSRLYVVNPMSKIDVSPIVRGLNASHSAIRGSATRLGAGEGADADADAGAARAAYRTTIKDFERSRGFGDDHADSSTGPAAA